MTFRGNAALGPFRLIDRKREGLMGTDLVCAGITIAWDVSRHKWTVPKIRANRALRLWLSSRDGKDWLKTYPVLKKP